MWYGKRISIVLPAYNEEENIRNAVEAFAATGIPDEIIVVDNNSRDRTAAEVAVTEARLVKETEQGYGAAMRRGLHEATGDYVITAEPDGTFVAADIVKLLAYADDFDLVLGTRTTKEMVWGGANMGWCMRTGNWIVAKLMEALHNTPSLSDCGCTMRLIHRDALDRILPLLCVKASHFLPEMLLVAHHNNVRLIEIPVNYRARIGDSKITGSLRGTLVTGWNMIRLALWHRVYPRRSAIALGTAAVPSVPRPTDRASTGAQVPDVAEEVWATQP